MAEIVDPLPAGPTSDPQIAEFESHIGYGLPDDYRAFLLQHNGGRPEPDAFTLNIFGDDEEDSVMCFFPVRDLKLGTIEVEEIDELRVSPLHCAWDDLQSDLVNLYEKQFDDPVLPIGTDGSTNYFCIVLSGDQRVAILFLENEMADTVVLADSFSEFLDVLRSSKEAE